VFEDRLGLLLVVLYVPDGFLNKSNSRLGRFAYKHRRFSRRTRKRNRAEPRRDAASLGGPRSGTKRGDAARRGEETARRLTEVEGTGEGEAGVRGGLLC